MPISITRTLTEHTNGKIEDPTYATGWKRRAGTERIDTTKPAKSGNLRTVYEEASAPLTVVYGSPEHLESGLRGGTVNTIIEGVEPATVDLYPDEIEVLIRRYLRDYQHAHFLLNGGTASGEPTMTPLEMVRLRDDALERLVRFGVDPTDHPSLLARGPEPKVEQVRA